MSTSGSTRAAPDLYSQRLLGNSQAFASSDLDQTRNVIARTYCPHQLSIARPDGSLCAWLNFRQLSLMSLAVMSYGAEVAISRVEDKDVVLLMLPLRGAADIGIGRSTIQSNSRRASVVSAFDLKQMRWSHDCSQIVVQIGVAAIERHITLMTGQAPIAPVRFAPEMEIREGYPSWWSCVSLLMDELSSSDPMAVPTSVHHWETMLVVKLLESQRNNYSEQLKPQTCKIAPYHVRKVERFIVDNAARPIGLEDLVAVSGVSARALFDGFRRFRRASPMNYLRSVRLDRVRHDLLNAQPKETVTGIACRWGFYQFGRFAGQYRRAFGELPSETLRERP